MHSSIVISVSVNAKWRMHKAYARPSPPFAPGNFGLFVVATAKLTGTHAPRRLPGYPLSMRGSAKKPNHKHVAELPGFPALRAKLVWTTPLTIAIRNRAGRIAREYARVGNDKWTFAKSFRQNMALMFASEQKRWYEV
jgi:hypothetical protein